MASPTPMYSSWHGAGTPGPDEVRTIFVTGFPADTKERELQNLLRWWPGYEACQLSLKGDSAIGFALFSTSTTAKAARDALQGLVFDLESNSTLRAEMAKKNLFVKRGVVPSTQGWDGNAAASPSTYDYDPNKRMRMGEAPVATYIQTIPGYGMAPIAVEPQPAYAYTYALPASPAPGVTMSPGQRFSQMTSPPASAPRTVSFSTPTATPRSRGDREKDNPPCNTLFVGNLGEDVQEAELHRVFGVFPGYRQLKLLRQSHSIVCFVEFDNVEAATAAHSATQALVLPSSGKGEVRVQFSKNPFGRKRDGSFHPRSAAAGASSPAAVGPRPAAGVPPAEGEVKGSGESVGESSQGFNAAA